MSSVGPDLLVAPALDCRTGGPPDLGRPVPVDHWVLFSTDEAPDDWGVAVDYGPGLRHKVRAFLPDRIVGGYHGDSGPLRNGDFAMSHEALLAGVRRLQPGERVP